MYLGNTAGWIKMSLRYSKVKRVNWNLFVQKCKPLQNLSKLMRKARRNITVLPSRPPEPTVCLTSINAIENLFLSSSCGIYILQSVTPLMQQRGLHWAMESTTLLIVFANPRPWDHSKTPDLLITAHRNMPSKVTNTQIGVRAATSQGSTQLGAHVQKRVKTGPRSWITVFSQNFLFARKQPRIFISKQWMHGKKVLTVREECANLDSYN